MGQPGTLAVATALGTGGTVATAGALLAGGGLAASLTGNAFAMVSHRSTGKHIEALQELYENHADYEGFPQCGYITDDGDKEETDSSRAGHRVVADHVLPYIIFQKTRKLGRKKVSSIPGISVMETVRSIGHYAHKKYQGEQGSVRNRAAGNLAAHLIECSCDLSRHISNEHLGNERTVYLLGAAQYDRIRSELADKMKSV